MMYKEMMFRRVTVNTEDRLDGDRKQFRFGVDGEVAKAFAGSQVHLAVEWIDTVRYSEVGSDYSVVSASHGPALLLECLNFSQGNTWQSWDSSPSRAMCLLQNYLQSGVYGICQDHAYARDKHMGIVVPGDALSAFGPLEFRMSMFTGSTVRPCTAAANMEAYSFGLVFWTVETPVPRGVSYPWYRAWLNTANRTSGTVQDAVVPFRLTTSRNAISDPLTKWMAVCDWHSPVKHDTANLSPGYKVVLSGLTMNQTYSDAFLPLNRSYRTGEEAFQGLRLSIKPAASDHIGFRTVINPDAINEVRLKILDTTTGAAPTDSNLLEDYLLSIVVFVV